MNGLEGWAHWGHPSKRDLAGASKAVDLPKIHRYSDPWFSGTMLDYDHSDLSSNLMPVFQFFVTLLLFAINKAYF